MTKSLFIPIFNSSELLSLTHREGNYLSAAEHCLSLLYTRFEDFH